MTAAAWKRKYGPAIDAEEQALDRITGFLMRPENRARGRTILEISEGTGLCVGRVEQICFASELVLKKLPYSPRWRLDWRDLAPSYRKLAVAQAQRLAG